MISARLLLLKKVDRNVMLKPSVFRSIAPALYLRAFCTSPPTVNEPKYLEKKTQTSCWKKTKHSWTSISAL
uniref:Uncharacterized protein n=1 Tax=Ditylenchus dipsaci TaxID=166011 RepID=A0A915DZI5_9BILA